MPTINEFIEIPITAEANIISRWIAERRILYEYPGHAPGSNHDENHIINIQKGTIVELTTFDYFHEILNEKFGALHYKKRWRAIQDRLCLQNHIGAFDKGSDLTIKNNTIDIKTYNKPITKQKMMKSNLFVGVRETKSIPSANFYIQAFFTSNNTVILAGYHEGLPKQIKYNIPTPAHFCPVKDLKPIKGLTELLLKE